jgi:hypothetical protein
MAAATAEQLWLRLGPKAMAIVELCLSDCGEENDAERHFWTQVAACLRSRGGGGQRADPPNISAQSTTVTWSLMQRVEKCRHAGLRGAHIASRYPEQRRQLIDIAVQWFELAEQAQRLATPVEAPTGPKRDPSSYRARAEACLARSGGVSPARSADWRHAATSWELLARLEEGPPHLSAPSRPTSTARQWVQDPVGRVLRMRLSASDSWTLEIEGVENPLRFARGLQAQAAAWRLGERLVRAGGAADLEIYPRGGPLGARLGCLENPDVVSRPRGRLGRAR